VHETSEEGHGSQRAVELMMMMNNLQQTEKPEERHTELRRTNIQKTRLLQQRTAFDDMFGSVAPNSRRHHQIRCPQTLTVTITDLRSQ
jgi:hypothetical protein